MELNIEYLPVEALRPYDRNARKHAKKDIDAIAASIREFGFDDPIGIWGDGLIVEGHGRLLAAKQLGMTSVPCIRLDHLTDKQRRAYTLAHNRTAELSGWDFDMQAAELAEIFDIDMEQFGFLEEGSEFFNREEKDGSTREEGNDEYNEFLDKFEQKKTTDDCYTSELVYDAVADFVSTKYGIERIRFVRPFYPGGDYQKFKYKVNAVVVDNPPFSILSEILRFYGQRGIQYFLFAPALTCLTQAAYESGATVLCAGSTVVYENGAEVSTSFVTNLEKEMIARTEPVLGRAVNEAVEKIRTKSKATLRRNSYPDQVVTSALMSKYSKYGVEFGVPRGEGILIDALDAQKDEGAAIFGHGLLLSARVSEAHNAAKLAAVKTETKEYSTTSWELSARE